MQLQTTSYGKTHKAYSPIAYTFTATNLVLLIPYLPEFL